MEEKTKMELQDNPPPKWVKIMWGIFTIWAIFYMVSYWLPDLTRWLKTAEPDTAQWQDYKKVD